MDDPRTPGEQLRQAAASLGDAKRFQILGLLVDGSLTVQEIVDQTGYRQPLVSHHLSVLFRSGWVEFEQDGRWHRYGLARDSQGPVGALIALFRGVATEHDGSVETRTELVPNGTPERSQSENADSRPLARPVQDPNSMEDYLL